MTELQEKLLEILNEKNTKIIPENIKKDVEILGVVGTLEEGSGSSLPLNIFMQDTEPETKEGIWLQGNYDVENLIADRGVFTTEEWNTDKMNSLQVLPYPFYNTDAVIIGTDAYLFGSYYSSDTKKYAYKYDTLTDTYTKLADIPTEFYHGSVVAIGTDIYLFGGGDSVDTATNKLAYKYDTLTDTYTRLTDIPYEFYYADATALGTDIYLFGAYVTSSTYANKYAYKYNTLTDTYTKLTNIPYRFLEGRCITVGTNIYLFGGRRRYFNTYKSI